MRAQKGKTTLFSLILSWLVLVFIPYSFSSEPIPESSIIDTATLEATKRFGDQSTAHFLRTFYDIKGSPSVHLFIVTKDRKTIPENLNFYIEKGNKLIEEGQALIRNGQVQEGQNLIAKGRARILQENGYGTLYVSARPVGPSLISFHHGLPNFVTSKKEAEKKAHDFSNGEKATALGILYISPFEYYFEFESKNRKILINAFSHTLIPRAKLEKSLISPDLQYFEDQNGNALFLNQQSINDTVDPDLTGAADPFTVSYDSYFISGVPDYHQPTEFPDSCGPTAGACLLGYWDSQGFGNLLKGKGNYNDVTGLIEELCGTMNWDPSFGVYYFQIPVGLQYIINDRGYGIGVSSLYGIDSFDIVTHEISEGRPFIYGSQENPWGIPHYVVVVGYQENFIIVHDNWKSTPINYFVNWDALGHSNDMMSILIAEGQAGPLNESLPSEIGGGGGCFIESVIVK